MVSDVWTKMMEAYKAEYGEDAVFEDGETQVFVLNDCTAIISKEGTEIRTIFTGDKPIKVDCASGFYAE